MFIVDDIVIDEDVINDEVLVYAYSVLISIKRNVKKIKKELNI